MSLLKNAIRRLIAKLGYNVTGVTSLSGHPFLDMKRFVPSNTSPLIFDVGANTGQSVTLFREVFPASIIHSFEPGSETFRKLSERVAGQQGVFSWNLALGASAGQEIFPENTLSDMSSFLELGPAGWGTVAKQTAVKVTTVDRFLEEHQISFVDILKSDTQGYELEVLKGAEQSLRANRVGLVYFEFIFSEIYKNLPAFDEIYRYLVDHGFMIVSVYDLRFQNNLLGTCDLLFVHKAYYAKTA